MLALKDFATWSIPDFLIAIIIIAACVGITILVLRQCEVSVPPAAVKILWIVLIVCLAIVAIRFIASL